MPEDEREWEAAGLLDGLEGEQRDDRVELLRWLTAKGFGPDELRRGHDGGLLPFLPAERVVMGGPPELTVHDLADHAGLDVELLQAIRRVQGLPRVPDGERFFSAAEAQAGQIAAFRDLGLGDEQVLEVSRVLGRGLGQAAQMMRSTILELTLEPGLSERELAERFEQIVEVVLPRVGPLLDDVVRMHLRNMVRSEGVDAQARVAGSLPGAHTVGVAFADLVGFTRMGEEVPAAEVGRVAGRLEALAAEVAGGTVRLVKTIGDAVMLVAEDPAELVLAGLDLVDLVAREGEDFPQVRVGMALGQAAPRGGDWFGAPVNLASRMTSLARAGSVLAAQALHDAAEGDERLRWSFAGERRVKGVSAPVKTFRARRA